MGYNTKWEKFIEQYVPGIIWAHFINKPYFICFSKQPHDVEWHDWHFIQEQSEIQRN